MTRNGNDSVPSAAVVLVLDRLGSFHSFVQGALGTSAYTVLWSQSALEALATLEHRRVTAVFVDVCVPDQGLLDGVESLVTAQTDAAKIVVTGCPLMDAAARVLYPEADGFLQKPCPPADVRSLVTQPPEPRSDTGDLPLPFHGIVGTSPAIRRVIDGIQRVAATASTVLITGETGAGKELVAAAIHECSPRHEGPYLVVDTLALSETLLESELFGHTRGAFTGAVKSKLGLLEAADGGTVFFDEIGDIPQPVQVRLLRAIQEQQVRPLGAVRPKDIDVRIIAATHRNLEAAVESGRFRADLFHRLNVYSIEIPPLRERTEDIPLLARHGLRAAGTIWGRVSDCSELVLRMLEAYDWPGNVRELLAVLEHALINSGGESISATHLPARIRVKWRDEMLAGGESRQRAAIAQALEDAGGRRGDAAVLLGVSRATLWRWMKRHDL